MKHDLNSYICMQVTQWCKSKGTKPIPFYETSAKDSVKVEDAFLEAAQAALHRDAASEADVFIPDTINLSKQPQQSAKSNSTSGCC